MAITIQDYEAFDRFARNKIAIHPPKSIEAILADWNRQQEVEETVASVKRGVQEFEEGKALSIEETMREVRKELGWGK